MAQMGMVMNLDKCIGCHTCSVTCKQAWTNRSGTEYVWFNNVETRPGQGYPRRYEDQDTWRGGWTLNSRGRLKLKAGGRVRKLLGIFASPVQPKLADYYEPWTYDYRTLIDAPLGDDFPVARPKSLITGEDTKITWSANWDDDLGGASEMGHLDPIVQRVRRESEDKIKFEFQQTFMFYLPRICEHCLNPSCMASCPSGAIYKRAEDGIVLVDQDRCRGWRQCVTGCPYKKIYFNHKTGKAEKCHLCYPRIEVGLPTVCSETCVGRLRYLGLFLYDADRVTAAAATRDEKDLYSAQLDLILDPNDHDVVAAARQQGIPADWLEAARRSPVFALAKTYKVALPLHPEYRTMPMVWYIPPLSPIVDLLRDQGHNGESTESPLRGHPSAAHSVGVPGRAVHGGRRRRDRARAFGTGGDARTHAQHHPRSSRRTTPSPLSVGMTDQSIREMYRLMAIAKYDERYVIPKAHVEQARGSEELGCSVDFDGGPYESRDRSARPVVTAHRWPWRPSRRFSNGRPPSSPLPPIPTPRSGEHAQLGRQRDTPGLVPEAPKEPA